MSNTQPVPVGLRRVLDVSLSPDLNKLRVTSEIGGDPTGPTTLDFDRNSFIKEVQEFITELLVP